MEISREIRELRRQYCVRLVRCSCGGFEIRVVAAEEISLTAYGYEYKRPVSITVYSSEPDDCERPIEYDTAMPASEDELKADVIQAFRAVGKEVADDDIQEINAALEAAHCALLELYIDDYSPQN